MPFVPKNWQDLPSISTPLSAAALEDLEARVAAYADAVASATGAVPKSLYSAQGGIAAGGGTASNPGQVELGDGFTFLRSNLLSGNGLGLDWARGMGPTVNVLDFAPEGSFYDGGPPQRAAIEAAMASAAALGAICFFPKAFYMVQSNQPLRIPSNSRIVAAPGAKLKATADATIGPLMQNLSTPFQNISIEGLEFDGNNAGREPFWNTDPAIAPGSPGHGVPRAGFGPCIEVRGPTTTIAARSSGFRLHRCYFHDSPYLAVATQCVDDIMWTENRLEDNFRDGLHVTFGDRGIIANNVVRNSGDDAICVHGGQGTFQSQNWAVTGNVVDGGGVTSTWPSGNDFTDSGGHAFVTSGTIGISVTGNRFMRGGHGGVMICNAGSGICRGVVVAGNVIENAGQDDFNSGDDNGHGIRIQVSPQGGYSVGVPANYPGAHEGNTPGPVTEITVVGNIIRNPNGSGIRLQGSSGNPHFFIAIRDNHIYGDPAGYTAASGILGLNGDNFVDVSGNMITNFPARGITIGNALNAATNWHIRGNTILNNGRSGSAPGREGIHLGALAGGSVSNNRVGDTQTSKTQSYGLNWGTASNVMVMGNDLSINATGSSTGTPGGTCVQALNRNQAGALLAGDAVVGTI